MLSLAAVYSARRDLSRQKLFAVNCTPSNDARLPIYSDFLSSKKCEETCLGELKLVLTHAFLERYFFWIGNEFSIREEKNKKKNVRHFFSRLIIDKETLLNSFNRKILGYKQKQKIK